MKQNLAARDALLTGAGGDAIKFKRSEFAEQRDVAKEILFPDGGCVQKASLFVLGQGSGVCAGFKAVARVLR